VDIKNFATFNDVQEINLGLDINTKKYRVICNDGSVCFLKIIKSPSPKKYYHHFVGLQKYYDKGLPIAKPIMADFDSEQAYLLYEFLNGGDLHEYMEQGKNCFERYTLGLQFAETLKKFNDHDLMEDSKKENYAVSNIASESMDWLSKHFDSKEARKTFFWDKLQESYEKIIPALKNRAVSIIHADMGPRNVLVQHRSQIQLDCELVLADYDTIEYGDPYLQFAAMIVMLQEQPAYCMGLLNGYIGNKVTEDFYELLDFYSLLVTCKRLYWLRDSDNFYKYEQYAKCGYRLLENFILHNSVYISEQTITKKSSDVNEPGIVITKPFSRLIAKIRSFGS